MKKLVSTKGMSREEWLSWRKKGIGGSDAGAIAGMNPWRSAIDVFMDKTNPEVTPQEERMPMKVGRYLEDLVARLWMEETGKTVRNNNHILQHDDYPFMLANIDREVVGEKAILECKTTSAFNQEQWKDDNIPQQYVIQCLHYLAVTGYDRCYLACLVGNHGFVTRVIERDEDAINALIAIEKDFWYFHVVQEKMPAPDGSDTAGDAIKTIYAEGDPDIEEVDLTDDFNDHILDRVDEIDGLIDALNTEKAEIVQNIQLAMKEAETAKIGGRKVTWKTYKGRKSFDSKRFKADHKDLYEEYITIGKPYRTFKIGKPVQAEQKGE